MSLVALALLIGCAAELAGHRERSPTSPDPDTSDTAAKETPQPHDTALDLDISRTISSDMLLPDSAHLAVYGEWTFGWVGDDTHLGDVDGDGLADLVVTSPSTLPFGELDGGNGVVYLISGLETGEQRISEAASTVIIVEAFGEYAVTDVAAGADLNGDGLEDLAVACSGNLYAEYSGAIFVLFGPVAPGLLDLQEAADLAIVGGPNPAFGFGTPHLNSYVEIVGDLNGDGSHDLAARGSTYHDDPWIECHFMEPELPCQGEIWLLHSPLASGAVDLQAVATLINPPAGGDAVLASGDLDADGVEDVVSGNKLDPKRAAEAGSVNVVYGPAAGVIELEFVDRRLGEGQQDRLGEAVGLGDVDGDGYDDLVAGAPETTVFSPFDSGVGRAYLIPGPIYGEERVDVDAVATLVGSDDNTSFGYEVEVVDIDQDGFADVAVTNHLLAPLPTTYISYGPLSGTLPMASQADATIQGAGTGLDIADADGDGYPDVLLGAVGDDTLVVDGGAAFLLLGGP